MTMGRNYVFFNFPIAMFEIVWEAPTLQKGVEDFLNKVMDYCLGERLQEEPLNDALSYFGISWTSATKNVDRAYKHCKDVYEGYNNFKITTGIEKGSLFEIRDNIQTYKDRYLIGLFAFLAVKSIVGKKKFAATNYAHILKRMAGGNSDELPPILHSYVGKRRRLEKLLFDLGEHKVTTYSVQGQRGFYVSTTLGFEQLAMEVERYRAPNMASIRKARKAQQKAAVAKMIAENEPK